MEENRRQDENAWTGWNGIRKGRKMAAGKKAGVQRSLSKMGQDGKESR